MKIYVGNLPFSVDEEALKSIFSDYSLEEVSLIKDKFTGRSKGFGFIVIADDESAKKAIAEFNDKEVEGRQLKVSEARPMEERSERPRRSFGGGDRDRGSRGGFGGGSRGNFGGGRRY